jgi:hypothetical protein
MTMSAIVLNHHPRTNGSFQLRRRALGVIGRRA